MCFGRYFFPKEFFDRARNALTLKNTIYTKVVASSRKAHPDPLTTIRPNSIESEN